MSVWQDLGLNLLAEAIGIVLTIFFINRILKQREEMRWQRVKHSVYRRLAVATDQLLADIATRGAYVHGMHPADSDEQGRRKSISYVTREYFEPEIKPLLKQRGEREWEQVRTSINQCIRELRQIVDTYYFLLDPSLISSVLAADEQMVEAMTLISQTAWKLSTSWSTSLDRDDLIAATKKVVESIVAIERHVPEPLLKWASIRYWDEHQE